MRVWGYATSFLRRQALTIPNPVPRLSSNRNKKEPERRLWRVKHEASGPEKNGGEREVWCLVRPVVAPGSPVPRLTSRGMITSKPFCLVNSGPSYGIQTQRGVVWVWVRV